MVAIVRSPKTGRSTGERIDSLSSGMAGGHAYCELTDLKLRSMAWYVLPGWQEEVVTAAQDIWVLCVLVQIPNVWWHIHGARAQLWPVGRMLGPRGCAANHVERVSISCGQVGAISALAPWSGSVGGISGLNMGKVVLLTPSGGPFSIMGYGILQTQQVDPKHVPADSGISTQPAAIFSQGLLWALGP